MTRALGAFVANIYPPDTMLESLFQLQSVLSIALLVDGEYNSNSNLTFIALNLH